MTLPAPRRHSPAAERNKGAILEVLQRLLPPSGRLLEIAAGTGQHAVHLAAGLPGWQWQATDPDPDALRSIAAWAASSPTPNLLLPPRQLDVQARPWLLEDAGNGAAWDAIYCANMLHIAPWSCCAALMQGAARLLSSAGLLLVYGPFRVEGETTAPSNERFDADLRARDPAWGIRWLHEVEHQARSAGLALQQRLAMPANNLMLVLGRKASNQPADPAAR